MRSKRALIDDLEHSLSQCEMNDFSDAVERGNARRARRILKTNGFSDKEADFLIADAQEQIQKDRAENPRLVAMSDVFLEAPPTLRKDAEAFFTLVNHPDIPPPVGRHDRVGLLWRRNELLAWLKKVAKWRRVENASKKAPKKP